MPQPTPITLVSFNGGNGATPDGGLLMDSAGDLFGTTDSGGANGDGTVFEIANTASGYASTPTTLVSFDGSDGSGPFAGLIADAAGDLFGTTQVGGANGKGTVFEVANTASGYADTPTTLVSFNGLEGANHSDGAGPFAGLIADASGNLFGTTSSGGSFAEGNVFEIAKTGTGPTGYASTATTLVSFDGGKDGSKPSAGVIMDGAGDLFGTTAGGDTSGQGNNGAVFEIVKTENGYASTPTVLFTFDGMHGSNPEGGLIMDPAGDLFGTTEDGGATGQGTVFELARTASGYASTPTTLVSFDIGDGSQPFAGLIMDAAGDLFGTTEQGGNGEGTVFEIANTASGYASTPTVLVSFNGANGADPVAGLIADAAGDLFGTTSKGGPNSSTDGTVFEVADSGFMPCFCRGTMILTPSGEVPVEALKVGDIVTTLSGAQRPIAWIGSGRSLVTAANPGARPVMLRRDAIADGVPCRDLHVTNGHSLYFDGLLIPAESLVNGRSIMWDEAARVVEFYHLELPSHDILIADGAPAESYKEDGNRDLFHNTDRPVVAATERQWFAPVCTDGAEVDRVWRRLVERSGWARPPLTRDPDLHLVADGSRIDAVAVEDRTYRFRLDKSPCELRIGSRNAVPHAIGRNSDFRRLGVAIRAIAVHVDGATFTMSYESPLLRDGFHDREAGPGFRWTDGDARLPSRALLAFDGAFELVLHVGGEMEYPIADRGIDQARDAA
ncbi:MAG: Hint domain-containing protein [Alphaproteobacteria bacterium]|nr:Hint domain-containing protein [Alphaproteobacteria bacterium]